MIDTFIEIPGPVAAKLRESIYIKESEMARPYDEIG